MAKIFQPTILLAIAMMAVISIMVLPVPAQVLDIGLVASFAIAILMFSVTLFIEKPLDFSSFPTVLLISLILRLSLNVASTKLIIGQGHTGTDAAGHVIEGFADFVIGGNVVLGLVTFGVLMIVNFVVINKGAARMAEVGARFALDGMPGRQLAIDSDMAAGAITHAEARARRERDHAETTFFGSLDGASKFVKGDAVAGLLITFLNLVVGLITGVIGHGMPIGVAFETYSILTIGDGLVSQLPAVIISVASAMLLARGADKGAVDLAILKQLGQSPSALFTVGALLFAFALVPGLPTIPFMIGAGGLIYAGFQMKKRVERGEILPPEEPVIDIPKPKDMIGDLLDLDDIHLEFAPDLVPMVLDPLTGLDGRIASIRKFIASGYGIILPDIRLTDSPALPSGVYVIKIQGVEQARDRLQPDKVLALAAPGEGGLIGDAAKEPVYGAPALWISPAEQEMAVMSGTTVVQPAEVLATHLLEIIKRNFARLLTGKSLRRMLEEVTRLSDSDRAEANKRLLAELIPDKVPFELLLAVMRLLLEERVSVRNWPLILEALAEGRGTYGSAEMLCEYVRKKLGFQLTAELRREDGSVPLLQLAPEWEEVFQQFQQAAPDGSISVALPPDRFNRLVAQVSDRITKAGQAGTFPALVVSSQRRRFLRSILSARGIANPVLSFDEVAGDRNPSIVGQVAA